VLNPWQLYFPFLLVLFLFYFYNEIMQAAGRKIGGWAFSVASARLTVSVKRHVKVIFMSCRLMTVEGSLVLIVGSVL